MPSMGCREKLRKRGWLGKVVQSRGCAPSGAGRPLNFTTAEYQDSVAMALPSLANLSLRGWNEHRGTKESSSLDLNPSLSASTSGWLPACHEPASPLNRLHDTRWLTAIRLYRMLSGMEPEGAMAEHLSTVQEAHSALFNPSSKTSQQTLYGPRALKKAPTLGKRPAEESTSTEAPTSGGTLSAEDEMKIKLAEDNGVVVIKLGDRNSLPEMTMKDQPVEKLMRTLATSSLAQDSAYLNWTNGASKGTDGLKAVTPSFADNVVVRFPVPSTLITFKTEEESGNQRIYTHQKQAVLRIREQMDLYHFRGNADVGGCKITAVRCVQMSKDRVEELMGSGRLHADFIPGFQTEMLKAKDLTWFWQEVKITAQDCALKDVICFAADPRHLRKGLYIRDFDVTCDCKGIFRKDEIIKHLTETLGWKTADMTFTWDDFYYDRTPTVILNDEKVGLSCVTWYQDVTLPSGGKVSMRGKIYLKLVHQIECKSNRSGMGNNEYNWITQRFDRLASARDLTQETGLTRVELTFYFDDKSPMTAYKSVPGGDLCTPIAEVNPEGSPEASTFMEAQIKKVIDDIIPGSLIYKSTHELMAQEWTKSLKNGVVICDTWYDKGMVAFSVNSLTKKVSSQPVFSNFSKKIDFAISMLATTPIVDVGLIYRGGEYRAPKKKEKRPKLTEVEKAARRIAKRQRLNAEAAKNMPKFGSIWSLTEREMMGHREDESDDDDDEEDEQEDDDKEDEEEQDVDADDDEDHAVDATESTPEDASQLSIMDGEIPTFELPKGYIGVLFQRYLRVRKSDPATAPVTLLSNFRAGNRLRTAVEPPVGFNRNGSLIDDSIMSAPERNTATAIVERLLRVSGFAPTTYIDLRPMYDGYKKLDSQKRLANATHAIALAKTTLPLTKENLILFASNKLKITSLVTYAQQSANEAQTELQEFVQRETTLTAIRTVQSRLLDVPGPGEPLQSLGVGVHNIVGIVQTTSKAGKHDHRLYIGQPDKSIACVKSKGFITDALLAHQDEMLPFKSPLPNKARGDKPADTCFINPAYDCTPFGTFEITELHVTLTYAKINGRLTIGGNVLYEPAAEPRFGSLDAMETESTAETAETVASPFVEISKTELQSAVKAEQAFPNNLCPDLAHNTVVFLGRTAEAVNYNNRKGIVLKLEGRGSVQHVFAGASLTESLPKLTTPGKVLRIKGFMKGDMMVEVSDPGQWEFQCDYYKLPEIKKGVPINGATQIAIQDVRSATVKVKGKKSNECSTLPLVRLEDGTVYRFKNPQAAEKKKLKSGCVFDIMSYQIMGK
jgi:hypothetical protein